MAPKPSAPLQTPEPSAEPTVDYVSLEAARDTVEGLVRRVVHPRDTVVTVSRRPTVFRYRYVDASAPAWEFSILVRDTSECPDSAIENAVTGAGWAPSEGYMADGPDGGTMGFWCRSFFCLIEASWDGGDDSDSTYVPAPGCSVTVTVTRRRSDDLPQWR